MPVKNLLQDVVPPPRRSIRNVPVPSYRKKETGTKVTAPTPIKEASKTPPPTPPKRPIRPVLIEDGTPAPKKKSRFLFWLIFFIIIAAAIFLFTTFFASATVAITPRQQKVTLDETLKAGDLTDGIPYEIVTHSKVLGKTVLATENEPTEDRASGTIIVYNKYNSATQRLVKNTRFETPEGLVFRIRDSVDVPGETVKNGQTVPGSAEVAVYADVPGEKYNIGLTDFTIPGFKGDPRHKDFYARSKTPMAGGFVGVKKKIASGVEEDALKEIEVSLRETLAIEIKGQIPDNFVLFNDALFYEFAEDAQTEVKDDSVKVNLKGTVRAAIFDKDLFEDFVANQASPALNNEDVELIGLQDLAVAVKEKEKVDIKNHSVFELGISGPAVVVALFPSEIIQGELVGGPKKSLQAVLSKYTSIQEAEARLSPFWKRSFPDSADKITIEKIILK